MEEGVALSAQCQRGFRERQIRKGESSYLAIMSSRSIWVQNTTLVVDVAGVKELVESVAWLTAVGHVSSHRVQVAYALGEFNVACVVEAGVAEYTDAVLFNTLRVSRLDS